VSKKQVVLNIWLGRKNKVWGGGMWEYAIDPCGVAHCNIPKSV
jgi:hypothetical protein